MGRPRRPTPCKWSAQWPWARAKIRRAAFCKPAMADRTRKADSETAATRFPDNRRPAMARWAEAEDLVEAQATGRQWSCAEVAGGGRADRAAVSKEWPCYGERSA